MITGWGECGTGFELIVRTDPYNRYQRSRINGQGGHAMGQGKYWSASTATRVS